MDKTEFLLAHYDLFEANRIAFNIKRDLDYPCTIFLNGLDAWRNFDSNKHRICIMHNSLPIKTGLDLLKSIRAVNDVIPVIFLMNTNDDVPRIMAYQRGADYVLSAKVNPVVLNQHIGVLIKRTTFLRTEEDVYLYKYKLDFNNRALCLDGSVILELTKRQAEVLLFLSKVPNKTVRREELLRALWQKDSFFKGRSMDVIMCLLRQKLSMLDGLSIETIHSVGFRLNLKKEHMTPSRMPATA